MNFTKYSAYALYMRGSSMSRPPMSDAGVFIQAGGLQGVATIFSAGLRAIAWRSKGRMCSRSCWMEK